MSLLSDKNWEKAMPFTVSIFIGLLLGFMLSRGTITYIEQIDNLVDVGVTFSSTLLGFLGVLIGILFTIRETKTGTILFNLEKFAILKEYLKTSIESGFYTLAFTVFLNLYSWECIEQIFLNLSPNDVVIILWTMIAGYFIASSWRVMSIMIAILFSKPKNYER